MKKISPEVRLRLKREQIQRQRAKLEKSLRRSEEISLEAIKKKNSTEYDEEDMWKADSSLMAPGGIEVGMRFLDKTRRSTHLQEKILYSPLKYQSVPNAELYYKTVLG